MKVKTIIHTAGGLKNNEVHCTRCNTLLWEASSEVHDPPPVNVWTSIEGSRLIVHHDQSQLSVARFDLCVPMSTIQAILPKSR